MTGSDRDHSNRPIDQMLRDLFAHDWAKLAAVAVVALVLGLIGILVAAGSEPVTAPPVEASATTTTTVTSTTSSTSVLAPASPPPTGADTTTTVAVEGEIEVVTSSVDFGEASTEAVIEIVNTGQGSASWTAESSSEAIVLSAATGELGTSETSNITLTLNREGITEGDLSETITISHSAGDVAVAVTGSHEDNPIIHNPQASPSTVTVGGCSGSTATVSARVRDTSELERVFVRWSPDGSATTETALSLAGNDIYQGTVGPFTTPQTASMRVIAFDVRGNAGGARLSLTVNACP